MDSYRFEQHALQVRVAHELHFLGPRQNLVPTFVTTSRAFSLWARIGVGILYFACFAAAIAQSPVQSRLRSQTAVMRMTPRPVTAIAEARHYFRGDAQANMAVASIGLLYLANGTQPKTKQLIKENENASYSRQGNRRRTEFNPEKISDHKAHRCDGVGRGRESSPLYMGRGRRGPQR